MISISLGQWRTGRVKRNAPMAIKSVLRVRFWRAILIASTVAELGVGHPGNWVSNSPSLTVSRFRQEKQCAA